MVWYNPRTWINSDRDSGPLGGPSDPGGIAAFIPDGGVTPRTAYVNDITAFNCSAVWAAVSLISEAIGSTPAHVYRRRKSGTLDKANDHEVQQVIDEIDVNHPSERCISITNDGAMSPSVYKSTAQGHLGIGGNHWAELRRNGRGQCTGLWMLQPRCVQTFINDTGQPYYHVYPMPQLADDSSALGLSFPSGVVPETMHYSEMLHVKGFSKDGIVGKSPLACAAASIGVNLLQDTYATQQLLRGRPLGFLKSLSRLSPKNVAKIWSNWRKMHEGVDNIRKVGVIHGGLDWVNIGATNAELEFLAQRKFQNYEVARWFRVPPHMLGELSDAKYSDVEQLMLEFILFTLLPWVTRWEEEFRIKLFTYSESFNHYVYFDLEHWLRGDSITRANVNQIKLRSAALTPDEWRAEDKKPPLPNGTGAKALAMASQYDLMERVYEGTSRLQGPAPQDETQPEPKDGKDTKTKKQIKNAELLAAVSNLLRERIDLDED